MKIVFVSNILNHHQNALCKELKERCNEFYFIATDNVETLGYQKSIDAEYIVKYYLEDEKRKAETLICDADAVIFGSCPTKLIKLRLQYNKLSFLYSERFFKKGTWRRFIPSTRKKIIERVIANKDNQLYVLCASAYLPYDLSFFNFPISKCYKWGYFPKAKQYSDIKTILQQKNSLSILWAGRLLELKHPEAALVLAKRLKRDGYNFQLNIIGDGPLKNTLENKIKKYQLENNVHMLGGMTPEQVRYYMEQSQIFLFTSDRHEGWGAVLNEAMNSGCAVVASHIIGSAPFLIDDMKNGILYKNGKMDDFYNRVTMLLNNQQICFNIGREAYQSIIQEWNATVAADRLVNIIEGLLKGDQKFYTKGVCSNATKLRENWYR